MDERELILRYLQQQKPPILDDIIPDTLQQITPEQAEQEGNVLLVSCKLNINDDILERGNLS